MTNPTPLSPAAQAVLDAAFPVYEEEEHLYVSTGEQHAAMIAAAALRAAADQASPEKQVKDIDYVHQMYTDGMRDALAVLQEIVDELEGAR